MFKLYSKGIGYLVLTIVILSGVGGLLHTIGVFGERVVFENSFQYKKGMESRALVLQSQIAEVDANMIKYPEKQQEFLAQRKVLEIQLKATQL